MNDKTIASGGDIAALIGRQDRLAVPHTLHITSAKGEQADILLAPEGLRAVEMEKFFAANRDKPPRRAGTHIAHTLLAFTLLANRFKAPNSVIFADRDGARLTAILDFHPEGPGNDDARFGGHRVVYNLPHSEEWKAWLHYDGAPMDQGQFAAFVEERLADVVMPNPQMLGDISDAAAGGDFGERSPAEELAYLAKTLGGTFATPAELVTLSRGLKVREDLTVKGRVNIDNGETEITYESQYSDGSGAPLRVPNLFLIGIPVYDLGERYVIAVRLRYRIVERKVKWFYQLYRLGKILDHAFTEAALRASADTGLPMYRGTDC